MSEQDEIELSSGIAAFEAKHFSRAMQLLKPLAESENADAQYRVAIMYQNGLGVVPHPDAAYQWMRRAAEQGHALAQHGLGFMYMEGDCVAKKDLTLLFPIMSNTFNYTSNHEIDSNQKSTSLNNSSVFASLIVARTNPSLSRSPTITSSDAELALMSGITAISVGLNAGSDLIDFNLSADRLSYKSTRT